MLGWQASRSDDSEESVHIRSSVAPSITRRAAPAIISAGAVAAAGVTILPLVELGPLSLGMAQHLAIMNVAAPLAAVIIARRLPVRRLSLLWPTGLMQILLLWAWHTPLVQRAVADSLALYALLLVALSLIALAFWTVLIAAAAVRRWGSLMALLVTGKLACLLGGLMIFARRDLYELPALVSALCATGPSTLADQQLAGLMMIVACPLSYAVAGVALAAQLMADLEQASMPSYAPASSR